MTSPPWPHHDSSQASRSKGRQLLTGDLCEVCQEAHDRHDPGVQQSVGAWRWSATGSIRLTVS